MSVPQGKRLALAVLVAALTVAIAVASPGLAASPRRPDLVVKALSATPASLAPGGKLSVSAKVADTGSAKAGASTTAVYLGKGHKYAHGDVKLGSLATPALAPGKSAALKGTLAVPGSTKAGSYTLIACADAASKVKEKSEADNCRAGSAIRIGSAPSSSGAETRGSPAPSGGAPAPSSGTSPAGGNPSPPTGGNEEPPKENPHENPHESPSEEPAGGGLPGSGEPVPPPPAPPTATPLASETATPFGEATNFLYEGPGHVQTGVEAEAIEPARAGVLRGRVLATDGTPLPSVTVTVLEHPELGQTVTRTDGVYELAVNSGGPIVLHFERPTFLPVDRRIDPAVRNYENVEDVVMKHFDADMTAIVPGASTYQVAQSSITNDESGKRRSTLIFEAGTTATMKLPDGTTKPLKQLHVRATEYTVGSRGPQTMPGDLPATSAYTFAADYSVDEAVEAGATGVQFNQPVPIYTENFLGMPVGTRVPLGTYDEASDKWIPENDGVVIKILSIVGGKAEIDVDGDGVADSGAKLTALGINDEEREALAATFEPGQTLWRIDVTHFSSRDWNFMIWPGPEASAPGPGEPVPKKPRNPGDPLPPCQAPTGSSIDCDSQALREQLPIAGTPYSLEYTSDRAPAREVSEIEIPVTGAHIPASVTHVELDIDVAGKRTHVEFTPAPNLTYTYKWDGKDAYGREVTGSVVGSDTVSYAYPAEYGAREPSPGLFATFAAYPETSLGRTTREEPTLSHTYEFTLTKKPASPPAGLGGWTVNVAHQLDPVDHLIELGTGESMPAPVQNFSRLVANPALEAVYPNRVEYLGAAWQPDGSIWFLEEFEEIVSERFQRRLLLRRAAPDGAISTIATMPAAAAEARYLAPASIVADPAGGAWVMSAAGNVEDVPVFHVATDGTVTKVTAGEEATREPATPNGGDGLPASQVVLEEPQALAVGNDGTLYIDTKERIQHVNASGTLETIYENGKGSSLEDLFNESIAFGPDGSLYIAYITFGGGRRIDRLYPSGKQEEVVGGGSEPCCSSGQRAKSINDQFFTPIAVSPTGNLIFGGGGYLNEVQDGLLKRLAGSSVGEQDFTSGGAALGTQATNSGNFQFSVAADGRIAAPTREAGLRAFEPGIPGFALDGYAVPSADGREVYRFDPNGRHTETVDALTGVTLEKFAYDAEGQLSSITDRDGRVTTIERGAGGVPTAIVSPTGERTTLSLDGEGNLATVKEPGLPATQLKYGTGGLLTEETDVDGGVHKFTYDASGLVTSDTDPDGVKSTVTASEGGGNRTVTVTSPLGHATTYTNGGSQEAGFHRTVTTPSGAQTVTNIAPDGSTVGTFPDGSVVTSKLGPDPRFGALGRFAKETTIKEPSGLTFTLAQKRTTTLGEPTNPFSVTDFTNTFKLGTRPPATQEYNGTTRTSTLTEAEGQKGTVKLDAKGHVVSVQEDASETPTTITVNGRGLVTETAQGTDKHEYTYDSHDRMASATDALGRTSHYEYDEAGRLKSSETPAGEKYLFEHDGLGHLTKLTEPTGSASHLAFTPGGRVHSFTPPGSGSGYVNAYNADGQIESTTLPGGRKITYGRDAGGRVNSVSYPEATVGVGYVGNGQQVASLTRTPVGGGTPEGLQMGYDGGLLTSQEWTGPAADGYTFGYDSNLQLAQTEAKAGGSFVTTSYRRDNDGRVVEEGPFRFTRSGPQGAITEIFGAALETTQTWDALGRLASRTETVNGHQIYKMVLTRDAAGQLTQKVETVGGASHTYTYGYDADGRLIEVHRDGTLVEKYAYDADGNRTTREVGGTSKTATYSAEGLLTGLGGTAYTTDADGFVVARGGDTFTYAARGELLSATVGGVTETYTYDGFGRLVARTVGGNTWRYLYGNPEQELQVTAAVEPDGTLDTLSYTDTGFLYSILRGSTRYYVSTDQVGSPRVVTDESGNVVKAVEYSAFGETLLDSAPSFELPIGYAGGIADPAAGIVHMGLRPYDPASGRFMARDPLGLGGGQANLFSYSGDEPIQHSDPIGLGSTALGLCDGFCVGVKFTMTEKGFSSCVELGGGEGNEFEYNPNADLDENKFYAKATASAGYGSILGGELGVESSVSEKCKETKAIYKGCTVGACVSPEGLTVDGYKVFEALAKPAKGGVELKATVGVCQQVLW